MVPFSIGFSLVLVAVGILLAIIFGLKSIANGKYEVKKIIPVMVPIVIFIISYIITDHATQAGIITMLLMVLIMAVYVLYTGFRSTFNL